MSIPDLSQFFEQPALMAFVAAFLARLVGLVVKDLDEVRSRALAVVFVVVFFVLGRVLGESERRLVVEFLYVLLTAVIHTGLLPYEEQVVQMVKGEAEKEG